jgi:small subunit ribosomal protein S1
VTKVVTFGAFVEILPGVEGLVHISELAQHHVENPREVVSQGDPVKVKIIEVDAERRRLSLSLKRVEEPQPPRARDEEPIEGTPQLDLSEEVFPEEPTAAEAGLELPTAEEPMTPPDVPDIEGEQVPAGVPAEQVDHSIEADQVAPEEHGPGDSEGAAPESPE